MYPGQPALQGVLSLILSTFAFDLAALPVSGSSAASARQLPWVGAAGRAAAPVLALPPQSDWMAGRQKYKSSLILWVWLIAMIIGAGISTLGGLQNLAGAGSGGL